MLFALPQVIPNTPLPMAIRSALILIWLAFLARGAFYATVFPMWEGLDESQHFAFVNHLHAFGNLPRPDGHLSAEISRSLEFLPVPWALDSLPPSALTHDEYWSLPEAQRAEREAMVRNISNALQAEEGTVFFYEGKQPPLYYLLCAPILKAVSGTHVATRLLVLRLFTVLLTSTVVPLTFLVVRRVLGDAVPALLSAALLTAMPQLLMTASQVGNTSLVIVLFSILAWALLRSDPWDLPGAALIGITLGAGFLTKGLFVACLPAVVVSGCAAVWRAPADKRKRVVGFVSAAAVLTLALAGWWYVRTLGSDGPVWNDAAPPVKGASALLSYAARTPWWDAVHFALNTHIWMGGWSVLGVRSWLYAVFRPIFLLMFLGGFIWMLRNRSRLPVIWCLYGGCWAAMIYHAFVTFTHHGTISTTGVYLFAVVSCECAILCCAARHWFPAGWPDRAIAVFAGMFLLLEAYATHFVLLPYYAGLIRHRPDGSLGTFYVSKAMELGWNEILLRLDVNKSSLLSPSLIGIIWGVFLIANTCLIIHAWRIASPKMRDNEPT